MGKPKSPTPPDPKETSAASTGTNISTAVANAYMGNVNEYTPDGSTVVKQSGVKSTYDPYTGKTYEIPTFDRTTTLSAPQQAIKGQQDAASLNLATLGNNLSGTLGKQLTGNFKLDNAATEDRLLELGRKRLDPMLDQQDEALRTRLANQGIKAGSEAYAREMSTQGQNRNDAVNQLLLNGRAQASQELLTEDNQRINQISALMSGGQVSQPQFMGTQMPTIPTTDTAGLINENFNQKMNIYNQQSAARQNLLGGLFGLGSAFITSDRRAKKNIKPVGNLMGHKLYSYKYKGDDKPQVGVMAQDVEKTRPDAVREINGLKQVNYGRLFGTGERAAA